MLGLGRWRSDVEQLAGEREVVGLHAAREQTVVADAVKARGQNVDQEPADGIGSEPRLSIVARGNIRRSRGNCGRKPGRSDRRVWGS